MKTASRFDLRALAPAALLVFSAGCYRSRVYKDPKTLTEYRAPRTTTTDATAPDDDDAEAFRAAPPPTLPSTSRSLPSPTEVRLSNGVRVVMLERHDFPSVSAVLVLDRGAAAGARGVASLYAAAMLGASGAYETNEAFSYLNWVGARVESQVWRDAVILHISALTPLFVSALSRGAPMFTSPSFEGDDLDTARTHRAAALAREGERPADVADDALHAAVFPAPHPYGIPVAGEPARLGWHGKSQAPASTTELVTDDAVRAFRDAQLTAEHVGVAVVGDFKPAAMQRLLEGALGKLPKHAASPMPSFPPLAPKGGRKVLLIDRPDAAQSSVAIGWPGPRAADPELVTLDVLAGATGGELSTRLNITVRKELGATYGVHMAATGLRDGGLVHIEAAIDTARTVDALRSLFAELERLRTEPLTAAELVAAKLRTYHDLERGSSHGLARYLARAIAEGQPPEHVVTHNARVAQVTSEAVRAAAERYLTLDEARIVIVGDASRLAAGLRELGVGDVTVAASPP